MSHAHSTIFLHCKISTHTQSNPCHTSLLHCPPSVLQERRGRALEPPGGRAAAVPRHVPSSWKREPRAPRQLTTCSWLRAQARARLTTDGRGTLISRARAGSECDKLDSSKVLARRTAWLTHTARTEAVHMTNVKGAQLGVERHTRSFQQRSIAHRRTAYPVDVRLMMSAPVQLDCDDHKS